MVLLLALIAILLFLIIVKFILPQLIRHSQLQKHYRSISPLPLSPIPFIGNLHQSDRRMYVFYELLLQLAKECQNQNKGVFCIWSAMRPVIFLCSGQGLEVYTFSIFSSNTIS